VIGPEKRRWQPDDRLSLISRRRSEPAAHKGATAGAG